MARFRRDGVKVRKWSIISEAGHLASEMMLREHFFA
jgi:hypothetical protein